MVLEIKREGGKVQKTENYGTNRAYPLKPDTHQI